MVPPTFPPFLSYLYNVSQPYGKTDEFRGLNPLYQVKKLVQRIPLRFPIEKKLKIEVKLQPDEMEYLREGYSLYLSEVEGAGHNEKIVGFNWLSTVVVNQSVIQMMKTRKGMLRSKYRGLPAILIPTPKTEVLHFEFDAKECYTQDPTTQVKSDVLPQLYKLFIAKLEPVPEFVRQRWPEIAPHKFKMKEDDVIEGITVSSIYTVQCMDIITKLRIKYPVRSKLCNHLQPFCLQPFLQLSIESYGFIWKCPVCNEPLKWNEIVKDESLEQLFLELPTKRSLKVDLASWSKGNYSILTPEQLAERLKETGQPDSDDDVVEIDSDTDDDTPPPRLSTPIVAPKAPLPAAPKAAPAAAPKAPAAALKAAPAAAPKAVPSTKAAPPPSRPPVKASLPAKTQAKPPTTTKLATKPPEKSKLATKPSAPPSKSKDTKATHRLSDKLKMDASDDSDSSDSSPAPKKKKLSTETKSSSRSVPPFPRTTLPAELRAMMDTDKIMKYINYVSVPFTRTEEQMLLSQFLSVTPIRSS